MTTQTLSAVAIDVVGQYHAAGKHLVCAYRLGADRAVGAVNQRFVSAVNARPLRFIEPVKASVIEAQRQVADFVAFGLGLGANGADFTIDQVSQRVADGIERVSAAASKVENGIGAAALDKVGALALPVARVSLNVANAVAERTKWLSERVAGQAGVVDAEPANAVQTAAKKAVKPARKAASGRTRRA